MKTSLACILLLVFAVLSAATALKESPTYDEPIHITSGYVYGRTGHYFLDPIHPPLFRLWLAAPLLLDHFNPHWPPPRSIIEKRIGLSDWLLNENGVAAGVLIQRSRGMALLAAIVLLALFTTWIVRALGGWVAIATLFFLVFCPSVVAYSHLATLDWPVASVAAIGLAAAWTLTRRPTLRWAVIVGSIVGVQIMVNWTGLILLPPMIYLVATEPFSSAQRPRREFWVIAGVACVAVCLLSYRGTELYRTIAGALDLKQALGSGAGQYFAGHSNDSHRPWPWFFTACLLLKTPIPLLVLGVAGLVLTARQHEDNARFLWRWTVIPAAFYLLVCSCAEDQLGIRRVLFVYPMLAVWAGVALNAAWKRGGRTRMMALLLAIWYGAESILIFPQYLAYSPVLLGGPTHLHRWLVESNSDWGQGMKAAALYLRQENVSSVYVWSRGAATLHDYGIHFISLDPETGAYTQEIEEPTMDIKSLRRIILVISATELSGFEQKDPTGFLSWLRPQSPAAFLMDSVFLFDVTGQSDLHRRLANHFESIGRADLATRENDFSHSK